MEQYEEYQSGILSLQLFEFNGISFIYYDPTNYSNITEITNTGYVIDIANKQKPEFNYESFIGRSGTIMNEYDLKFYILGNTQDNRELISILCESRSGWALNIRYYDGTTKFYNTPLFFDKSKIEMQKEQAFEIRLKSRVPTAVSNLDFVSDVGTLNVIRADNATITADNTLFTADYLQ